MTKLPGVSGRDLVKALAKIGYLSEHQTGRHIILRHHAPPPNHNAVDLRIGTGYNPI